MGNVTGWTEILDGKLIEAVYGMYNLALNGWFVTILFFSFQLILYIKTKNMTLTWVTGMIFASMYVGTAVFNNPVAKSVMFVMLTLQLGGILYMLLAK